ncbi:MAG: hypothetical protein KKG09_00550 [Verrucomicrobia bacterium]|nr:hypothetical protein [Verrucomicrobiota bacterium]MCG2678494.1 hypothetical protein [Kiritimatiellia bacterium]MBU4248000.1 hypothetical protein [Verrucomicrobiota bacterium]MBU4289587.1 hypothetical protein [Verrucomicrobiota bacterium]MBU4427739.1 hypothetical protein [Verrucomicrobiota bacterium]
MRENVVLITGVCLMVCLAGIIRAEEASAPVPAPVTPSVSPVAPKPVHSLGHKIIFYLPNRFLDLVDIVRFRLRAGPGLAADACMTMYAANFIGEYNTIYAGLPGPRRAPVLPRPVGREALKGLLVMGVDATDETLYPPHYSESEMALGAQLLLVGLDVGFDPIELGDFLMGWVLVDITGDDL